MTLGQTKPPIFNPAGTNLGCIGFVIVALLTAHISARIMCVVVIIAAFGADAYFVDGLHVSDFKHNTLSDGSNLAFPWNVVLGVGSFLLWALFVFGAEFIVGMTQRWRRRAEIN